MKQIAQMTDLELAKFIEDNYFDPWEDAAPLEAAKRLKIYTQQSKPKPPELRTLKEGDIPK